MTDANGQGLERRTFLKRMATVAGAAPLAPGLLGAAATGIPRGASLDIANLIAVRSHDVTVRRNDFDFHGVAFHQLHELFFDFHLVQTW